jgi:hypothetical protein
MAVRLALVVALLTLLAACGDSADTTTTSTAVIPPSPTTTTIAPAGETGGGTGATTTVATTTAIPGLFVPEFTIVERTPDDVLVVAVAPGTYSDIDLQNLVSEVVEHFAPVNALHIVDDEGATDLVLAETVTVEEQAFLDDHYFLRLEEGFRMVFVGPFADVGEVILGS